MSLGESSPRTVEDGAPPGSPGSMDLGGSDSDSGIDGDTLVGEIKIKQVSSRHFQQQRSTIKLDMTGKCFPEFSSSLYVIICHSVLGLVI